MVVHPQQCFGMGLQLARAHGLAGFGTADLHCMLAHWVGFKVMVETDYTVNFGAGEIKAGGNRRHCGIRDIAQLRLNGV